MSQIDELKREIRQAKKLHLPWRAQLLIFALCTVTFSAFAVYGKFELAMPVVNVAGVLGLTIWFKWKLKNHAWFWITMAVIAALHIPLILFIPWTTRWVPGVAIAVIDSIDFCLMIWIVSAVGDLVGSSKAAE